MKPLGMCRYCGQRPATSTTALGLCARCTLTQMRVGHWIYTRQVSRCSACRERRMRSLEREFGTRRDGTDFLPSNLDAPGRISSRGCVILRAPESWELPADLWLSA